MLFEVSAPFCIGGSDSKREIIFVQVKLGVCVCVCVCVCLMQCVENDIWSGNRH